jgi:hypothetical protein
MQIKRKEQQDSSLLSNKNRGFFCCILFCFARGKENNKDKGRNELNWQVRMRKYGMEK